MTSRTYALSRQRRRRTVSTRAPDVPRPGQPVAAGTAQPFPLGQDTEHKPTADDADPAPTDAATHAAGARPALPRLPHEHDEHADVPSPPRAPIVQAARDLASGQVDTDLRGKAAAAFERAPPGKTKRR